MRWWILASIFAVRPLAHSSASALLRKVLITSRCKLFAYECQRAADTSDVGGLAVTADCNSQLSLTTIRSQRLRNSLISHPLTDLNGGRCTVRTVLSL